MDIQLQKLIERLVQRIDIERIYHFAFPAEEGEESQSSQLLLVVNPVKGMAPNALAPIVSLCMSDLDKEIPFDMIIAGEWSNKVKQGSLYHTYVSLPEHLCYASKKKPKILLTDKNITGLLELAQYDYRKARAISDEFRAGVDNFKAKQDYTQATYMLHQFVETRIKAFKTSVVGGKSTKGHNLEQLIKSIRGTLPSMHDLFPYDELQAELLRKLDQSYVKTLKWEQIDIAKEEFDALLHKCEAATEEMDKRVALMAACITAYRDKKSAEQEKIPQELVVNTPVQADSCIPKQEAQPVKTIACEDFTHYPWLPEYRADANRLLDKIRTNHNPEQITMLNYHTGGFSGGSLFQQEQEEKGGSKVELYLVVIMKNTGPFHFKCMQVGVASAMVLYLNVSYIERKLAEGDRFVHTLWTKGQVLRRKSSFEPKFEITEIDWKKEVEEVEKCINMTMQVIEENREYLELNDSETKINYCVLRSMLEAVVVSYLHCAVGYVAKDVPLRDLVDWTGVCGRELIEFLQPKKQAESRQLHLFLRPEKMWMNGFFDQLSEHSFLDDQKVQAHLVFYNKLLEDVLQQNKLLINPEVEIEAVGKL